MIGETLAHYRILEKLGAGGMGEVYRAADTKLGRDVAIKVIPKSLAFSGELLARFEREARALAAVDHPNIAAIYSFESAELGDADGTEARSIRFLVMQLVEGETLDEVIARGVLPVERALGIARQIAEALESAHERGIVHRDLKPGNIKIDQTGRVRVLDFGLAKFLEAAGQEAGDAGRPASQSQSSPTMKLSHLTPSSGVDVTREGALLGTAAYMSPEQARGLAVDERSDIWSFGCVLYEMLTGKRPFGGNTLSDCIAQIIEREPDLGKLPASVPSSIRTLISLCLTKDSKQRLHDMADVRLWLDRWVELEPARTRPVPLWRRALPWVLVAVMAGVAAWSLLLSVPESRDRGMVWRFALQTGQLAIGPSPTAPIVELSPDGRMLAYVTGEGDFGQLYVRSLDSLEPRPIAGAERARAPFFSPDGKWIGFESGNQLVKAPVEGGKAWVISDAANFTGAVWTQRGIIFGSPLRIVSPEGGEPEMLHSPQVTSEAAWLAWPQLLPDGRSLMFTTVDAAGYGAAIELFDLDTREVRRLIANGGNARYLSTGQIAYALDGSLMVVPFDLERREVTGRPVAAFDGLLMGFPWAPAMAHFAASGDGTLVYVAGPVIAVGSQLLRVERDGTTIAVGDPQRTIRGPSFSPDGEKIVVSAEVGGNPSQVWIHDLRRGTFTRLTPDEAWWPEWTPDGRRIVFTGVDVGDSTAQLFRMPADGSAGPERLTTSSLAQQVSSFSSDGRTMILHEVDLAGTKWDVLGMDLASPGAVPQPLLNDPYFELLAELSPDGRWLAYASNESGRYEVYVRSYPELDRKWQISADGGFEPVWSRDGTELFYRDEEGRRLISVDVAFEPEFKVGGTEVVLDQPFVPSVGFGRNYDVAPDGRSFLFVRQDLGEVERARLQVVLNWDDEVAAILSDETP